MLSWVSMTASKAGDLSWRNVGCSSGHHQAFSQPCRRAYMPTILLPEPPSAAKDPLVELVVESLYRASLPAVDLFLRRPETKKGLERYAVAILRRAVARLNPVQRLFVINNTMVNDCPQGGVFVNVGGKSLRAVTVDRLTFLRLYRQIHRRQQRRAVGAVVE